VINLPNSLLIALAAPLRKAVMRPVCCTLQGEELFIDGLIAPYREQALELIRAQVSRVDRFVAVSEFCAGFMSRYLRIPEEKISVVPLGINMTGYERHSHESQDGVFRIGYFARIASEKGLHVLGDAYLRFRSRIGDAPVRLEAAGYTAPNDKRYRDEIGAKLEKAGFAGEFSYRGVLDREAKIDFLKGLDVLSVPATYDEPKGMFLLEAMASGVPVVQPRRGAFIEIIEKTGGGLLVEPDDPDALADGLYGLWQDRARLAALADRAFHGVRANYSVKNSADRLLEVYGGLSYAYA
jgi:glycosyltransferase involved in cell wall biosynthesis